MFPTVIIVPLALKVVPALIEPTDEIFPSDDMLSEFLVSCDMIEPLSPDLVHFGGETVGSPTFSPLLHLTVSSK